MMYMIISGLLGIIGLVVLFIGIKHKKETNQDKSTTNNVQYKIIIGVVIAVLTVLVMIIGIVSGDKTDKKSITESVLSSTKEKNILNVDKKTITLKDGKAKINVKLDENTKLEVKHMNGTVDTIKYEPQKNLQTLNIVFVVAGKYELIATKDKKKVTEKVTVKKDPHLAVSSSESEKTTELGEEIKEQPESVLEENPTIIVPTKEDSTISENQSGFVQQTTEVVPNNNLTESPTGDATNNEATNNKPNVDRNFSDSDQVLKNDDVVVPDSDNEKSEVDEAIKHNTKNQNDSSASSDI